MKGMEYGFWRCKLCNKWMQYDMWSHEMAKIMHVKKLARLESYPNVMRMGFVIMDHVCVVMSYGIIEVPR